MHSILYIVRRIVRNAGFSLTVVMTIALGVGLNTGVASLTQAILFKSLGVPDPNTLVNFKLGNGQDSINFFSGPGYEAMRHLSGVSDLLAWTSTKFRLQIGKGPEQSNKLGGALATGNTFSVLRLQPSLGRFFTEAEDSPGGGPRGWTAVLGYSYWKSHYGANSDVLGQVVYVDGTPVHIIGVLPPRFSGLSLLEPTDIVLPSHFSSVNSPSEDRLANPGYFDWFVSGRLPPGTTLQRVQANLKSIEPSFRQLADPKGNIFTSDNYPNTPKGSLISVADGRFGMSFQFQTLRIPLLAIDVLTAFLFLFCCCNLILLLTERASREAHAVAVRMALGASASREARFAIIEAATLTMIGCISALPISWSVARILSRIIQSVPSFDTFPTILPNLPLLGAAMAITLVLAIAASTFISKMQRTEHSSLLLRAGNRSSTLHSNVWIVAIEVFASILLMTGAAVDGIGFDRLVHEPSGFATQSTIIAELDFQEPASTPDSSTGKLSRILANIEQYPGVRAVATINVPPLSGDTASDTVIALGDQGSSHKQEIWPADVSLNFFSAIGTRIVHGRGFEREDRAGEKVCVIGGRVASTLFYQESALGKYLYENGNPSKTESLKPYCRIIGVAEDVHFLSMTEPSDAVVYRLTQNQFTNVVIQAASSNLAVQAVRSAVIANAPGSIEARISTIQSHIDDNLRLLKVITLSGALCAAIAAAILGIGFFGILALQVSQRKREIGIQIALGATRLGICASLIRKLRLSIAIGLVFGSALAIAAAVALAHLYKLTIAAAIAGYLCSLVLLAILMIAAAAIPLKRALSVSPMECLASE